MDLTKFLDANIYKLKSKLKYYNYLIDEHKDDLTKEDILKIKKEVEKIQLRIQLLSYDLTMIREF